MTHTLLACPPVDAALQRALGIVGFVAGPDQRKGVCEVCQAKVWMGPRIRATKEAQPEARIVCFKCALQQPGTVSHLGGKGGSYLVKTR
jgi:hypothetical protein